MLHLLQGNPDIDGFDLLEHIEGDLCLPELGAWLLPCRQLRRLEVTAPRLLLAPGVLRHLPTLQHLRLTVNMSMYGQGGGVLLD